MTAEEMKKLQALLQEEQAPIVAPPQAEPLPIEPMDPNAGISKPRSYSQQQADPYTAASDQYLKEAADLEKQASMPAPKPKGLKENLVAGARAFLEGLSNPRDPYAMAKRREDQYTMGQQDLVARAKAARQNAAQQQQFGQSATRISQDQDQIDFAKEQANRPQPVSLAPGTQYGSRNPVTGDVTVQGTVPTKPTSSEKFVDRYDDKSGHMFRDYFNEGSPDKVYFSKDLGEPRSVVAADTSGVTVEYTDSETGMPVLGVRKRGSNVIQPTVVAGTGGQQAQGATAGKTAAKQGVEYITNAVDAERLYNTMNETLDRIESGQSKAIGADDMVLLSNHIAMTFGNVKGARTGTEIIEAHRDAIAADERISRAVNQVMNGAQLTADQRHEFVDLARRRVDEIKRSGGAFKEAVAAPSSTTGGARVIQYDKNGKRVQ